MERESSLAERVRKDKELADENYARRVRQGLVSDESLNDLEELTVSESPEKETSPPKRTSGRKKKK